MEVWGYLIAVGIGAILTEGLRWLWDWRQGKERYKLMLYEKRLEVHQKAYSCIRKLRLAMDQHDKEKIEVTDQADEWYFSNCFYLDEESRAKMYQATGKVRELIDLRGPQAQDRELARIALQEAFKAVEKGIGMKHLEKPAQMAKSKG
jgi:hypothetical protein